MDFSLIIDHFLDDYDWFRVYCDKLEYSGEVNPADNILYPGINTKIPIGISADVVAKLQRVIDGRIAKITLFLRMTTEGVDIPHQAHTDVIMGKYGMILYLNRQEHCKGGTAFVSHIETGLSHNPCNEEEQAIWDFDVNNYDKWQIDEMIDMKSNRAFIFDTDQMHRAEPPSGFGHTPVDGRLVMVCFFEVYDG